ncbi:MAG: hypothetical protein AB1921_15200 [Thermodesulfobacteriota bacterium]
MKKIVILAILVGLVYLAHRLNPSFDMHKRKIAPNIAVTSEVWNSLNYKDYYLLSVTTTAVRGALVSAGGVGTVGIIDKEWEPGNP